MGYSTVKKYHHKDYQLAVQRKSRFFYANSCITVYMLLYVSKMSKTDWDAKTLNRTYYLERNFLQKASIQLSLRKLKDLKTENKILCLV